MTASPPAKAPPGRGLSARLLWVVIAAVLLSEVLVFVPSLAAELKDQLERRLEAAQLAVLSQQTAADLQLEKESREQILATTDAYLISFLTDQGQSLAFPGDETFTVGYTSSFENWRWGHLTRLAFRLLAPAPRNQALRVIDLPAKGGMVELVLKRESLSQQLRGFAVQMFWALLFISGLTGALAYLALYFWVVRPIQRLTSALTVFSERPDDPTGQLVASERRDEIGLAERQTRATQEAVRDTMAQQARLAALGAAVAQINHDMKNSLATATLLADRLAASHDQSVVRTAPTLAASLERASTLLEVTLAYARSGSLRIDRQRLSYGDLVQALTEALEPQLAPLTFTAIGDRAYPLFGDQDHLLRALTNLLLNAIEAGATHLTLTLKNGTDALGRGAPDRLEVKDNGPGLPPLAQRHLFEPFAGSTKAGGTGLGLVTTREVFRAHGGDLTLVSTDTEGSLFAAELPAWTG